MKVKVPICLATSTHKDDDKLVNHVKKNYNIEIFRGSRDNKINRWASCFKKLSIDYAAFIDGDDLAFDYLIYKKYLNKIKKKHKKNLVFKFPEKIVTGTFTYIFSAKL